MIAKFVDILKKQRKIYLVSETDKIFSLHIVHLYARIFQYKLNFFTLPAGIMSRIRGYVSIRYERKNAVKIKLPSTL